MEYNKDQALRDSLLGLTGKPFRGGVECFDGLTVEQLISLIELRFLDPEETQNESPTVAEFIKFMCMWPSIKAHGYAVDGSRADYRITIEGLKFEGPVSKAMLDAFVEFSFGADDCVATKNMLYNWWD